MSKEITEKKYYRVSNTDKNYNGLLDVPFGIWITTHNKKIPSGLINKIYNKFGYC